MSLSEEEGAAAADTDTLETTRESDLGYLAGTQS